MSKKAFKAIEGVWPSKMQIGPNMWRIEPLPNPRVSIYPENKDTPLEDFIIVDHEKHRIGLVGDHAPDTLAQVISDLINGEGTTAAERAGDA